MMNSTTGEQHKLYMLRIWQEAPVPTWRCLLQDLFNEEMRAFPSIEHLEIFLQTLLQEEDPTP